VDEEDGNDNSSLSLFWNIDEDDGEDRGDAEGKRGTTMDWSVFEGGLY
jgi:hypothetical protein